jgi:hypothetical protein
LAPFAVSMLASPASVAQSSLRHCVRLLSPAQLLRRSSLDDCLGLFSIHSDRRFCWIDRVLIRAFLPPFGSILLYSFSTSIRIFSARVLLRLGSYRRIFSFDSRLIGCFFRSIHLYSLYYSAVWRRSVVICYSPTSILFLLGLFRSSM